MSRPASPTASFPPQEPAVTNASLKEHLRKSRLVDSILSNTLSDAATSKPKLSDVWAAAAATKKAVAKLTASISAPKLPQAPGDSPQSRRPGTSVSASRSGLLPTDTMKQTGPVSDHVFPDWLLSRDDFKSINGESLAAAVARRDDAEGYIRSELGIEPRSFHKYFQGPQRTLHMRRNAVAYTNTNAVRKPIDEEDGDSGSVGSRRSSYVRVEDLKAANPAKPLMGTGCTLKRAPSQKQAKNLVNRRAGVHVSAVEDEAAEKQRILAPLEVPPWFGP
jgi:hypothetical protein